MLADEERQRCAEELLRAERQRQPIRQPSRRWPAIEIADAYAIQGLCAQMRLRGGARHIGYKIGLTSPAMQRALQATEPDRGCIFDDLVYRAGARVAADRFLKPALETEVAFVLGEDLPGPDASVAAVLSATRLALPALEIVDRRTELPRALADTIADNAAFGAIVLGEPAVRPAGIEIGRIGATLARNGVIEESGAAAAVMGHPAAAVAWLANHLHASGAALQRDQIVLSGAFLRPVEFRAGDVIVADYGPFGTIEVAFV